MCRHAGGIAKVLGEGKGSGFIAGLSPKGMSLGAE